MHGAEDSAFLEQGQFYQRLQLLVIKILTDRDSSSLQARASEADGPTAEVSNRQVQGGTFRD